MLLLTSARTSAIMATGCCRVCSYYILHSRGPRGRPTRPRGRGVLPALSKPHPVAICLMAQKTHTCPDVMLEKMIP